MSEGVEWERPIGLTAECAICLDDSDDDDEGSSGDGRVDVDGDQSKAVSKQKCDSSLHHDVVSRTGSAASSYFQKKSELNEKNEGGHVASTNDSEDDGQPKTKNNHTAQDGDNETNRTADDDNSRNMMTNTAISDVDDNTTGPSTNEEVVVKNDNPFASFAFTAEESSSASSSWRPKKRPNCSNIKPSHQQRTKKKNNAAAPNKQRKTAHSVSSKSPKNPINPALEAFQSRQLTHSEKDEARQKEKIERQNIIAKWHAFADPKAPNEQQRFQVLVAARLHARCQEPVVKKAMDRLREHFDEKDSLGGVSCDEAAKSEEKTALPGEQPNIPQSAMTSQPQSKCIGLSALSLSSSNPETEIAPLLSSVLFGNVKAKHIVQAAQDVLTQFRGEVPESLGLVQNWLRF